MRVCGNGHPQPDEARFCGVCGASVAPTTPPPPPPFVPSSTAPPGPLAAPQPTAAPPPTVAGVPSVAPPLAPLAEASPTATGRPPRDRTVTALVAAIVVVGLVVAGLVAVLLLGDDDGGVETADADTTIATDADPATSTTGGAPDTTSTTARSTSTGAPASTATSVGSTTASSAGSTSGTAPGTAPLPAGTWITVLSSIPAGAADLDARIAELRSEVGSVSTLVSDGYASLTPGFVVVYAGSAPSGPAALDRCYALGRTSSRTCYAAPLTQSTADRSTRLYP